MVDIFTGPITRAQMMENLVNLLDGYTAKDLAIVITEILVVTDRIDNQINKETDHAESG